jgi:SAM-dependent methyltransferase
MDVGMSREVLNLNEVRNLPDLIIAGGFDFIDFGCSKGGSLAFAKKRFGGVRGLGIDIAQSKVDSTRKTGLDAICYNIHDIPDEKLVRFVIMSHFLEHVPAPSDVKAFLRKACVISKEFVYIQQPYFDADGNLFKRGLKLFWSDWTGHPNRMTSLELWLLLRDLQREGLPISYSIHAYKPIVDSADPSIHSLGSPIDQHAYVVGQHPDKEPAVTFENNVFSELICLITFPGTDHAEILKKVRYDCTMVDANGNVMPIADTDGKAAGASGGPVTLGKLKRALRFFRLGGKD